jgi:hypothetical protein
MIRLARKPSMWTAFFGRLLFCVIWAGAFAVLSWFVWTYHRRDTPVVILIVLGIFDFFAIGLIWDIVVRFWRTLTNREPQLEIDHDNLQLGSTAQIQFHEEKPESLAEIEVRLVAMATVTTRSGSTTITRTAPCHDQELLHVNVDGPNPITRSLQIKIPTGEFGDARWMINVNTRLRQGGFVQHSYPLKIM